MKKLLVGLLALGSLSSFAICIERGSEVKVMDNVSDRLETSLIEKGLVPSRNIDLVDSDYIISYKTHLKYIKVANSKPFSWHQNTFTLRKHKSLEKFFGAIIMLEKVFKNSDGQVLKKEILKSKGSSLSTSKHDVINNKTIMNDMLDKIKNLSICN
jgi:hypothetical protein